MKLRILCPECQCWTTTEQIDAAAWTCSSCGFLLPAEATPPVSPPYKGGGKSCRRCGNHEFYVQKAFPHWLGMGVLVVACLASVVTYGLYWIMTTWMILLGSALVDCLLYLMMGNVTVCYRCRTQYHGFPPNPAHEPFDLAIGERYRQERLRRQQLKEG